MDTRTLGTTGPTVSTLGLGLMGMTALYGPADRDESIATIHAALDAGITLLDSGDWYGQGSNELLVRDALVGRNREHLVICVKFGVLHDPSGAVIGTDNRPSSVKNFLGYTLKRLGTDYVDIYRPSRLDRAVPIEDTVGAIADLVKAGYVRHIGLSEIGPETLRRGYAVHPISDVQMEYSLISCGIESGLLPAARELGVGITAYGVLSRGLISGHWTKLRETQQDFRTSLPRFTGDNLDRNLALVEELRGVADAKGVTVAQIAIAWVLSRGVDIVPIVGARRRDRLVETLGSLKIRLTEQDLAVIEAAVPPDAAAGTRYDARQMSILDSERK
jgi:aryl-alcohol dehydrogenase-like predicted oxidoreductase